MKTTLVLAEGHTEERFVKDVLQPHFWTLGLHLEPSILITKRVNSGGSFRGGVTSFGRFESDVRRLLDTKGRHLVTTMIDFNGLPTDFPGKSRLPHGSPHRKAEFLEEAIADHFGNRADFLPYLSLHEFEALLFASSNELAAAMIEPRKAQDLARIREAYPTPEDINEREWPSKRIQALFPGYRKRLHGPATTSRIGLATLRRECPHFAQWLERLEAHAEV